MMYTNVLLRRVGTEFRDLGVSVIDSAGMYHTECSWTREGTTWEVYRGCDHARGADPSPHGAQPEQARLAAKGTEPAPGSRNF